MRKLKARENCRFRLPDADLLRMCVDWAADNTKQPAEFTSEIYDIINANLAQFNIEFYHGSAICDEVRQNCALKIFRYTIPKMLADVAKATRVKPHSYIFQAAYFEVMQYVRKFKRRHRLSFDVNELNELLGELVYADGRKTTTKSNEIDKFHEVVGNG